jgi:hypothetical protein
MVFLLGVFRLGYRRRAGIRHGSGPKIQRSSARQNLFRLKYGPSITPGANAGHWRP